MVAFKEKTPIGFAYCQLRYDYVEGMHSSPVGYLEGIYIEPSERNNGYARQLLSECESWAKQKECTEFASDCESQNKSVMSSTLRKKRTIRFIFIRTTTDMIE